MMFQKIIDISLAGYLIRLRFENREPFHTLEENLIEKCEIYYHNFIVNTNIKPDFIINIKNSQKASLHYDPQKKLQYISYCKKENKQELTTYYYTSAKQLRMLVKNIIFTLLTHDGGLTLHSSANLINGKSHVFVGKSGAGKSTIMKILKKKFQPFADDSLFVKKVNRKYLTYQTTFSSEENWLTKGPAHAFLKNIYILKQDPHNNKTRITDKGKAIRYLFKNLWKDNYLSKQLLVNLTVFLNHFNNLYELRFNKTNHDELINLLQKG